MADIELLEIQSGYNVDRINYNFDLIKAMLNDYAFHRADGNNVMQQTIDMNGYRTINVPDPIYPTEAVNKRFLEEVALSGVLPIYPAPVPVAVIDMASDNYTMTDAEAEATVKIVLNNVAGTTLTFPSTSDEIAPGRQLLLFSGSNYGMTIAGQTGGISMAVANTPQIIDFAYVVGQNIGQINASVIIPREVTGTSYSYNVRDRGSILRFTDNSDISFNLNGFFSTGQFVGVEQAGNGTVIFNGTVRSSKGHDRTAGPGSLVWAYCTDVAGEVLLFGDTTSAQAETLSSSGVLTLSRNTDGYFKVPLTQNIVDIVIDGSIESTTLMVEITQDLTTPYTITWPASFKWVGGVVPAVSTSLGAVDLLALTTFDNGTTWKATLAKGFA